MREAKVRFTIWLEKSVYEAAQIRAQRGNLSVSVVLADAAKESLLESYRTERETEILKSVERVFHKIHKMEQRHDFDHRVLQEMAGLAVLSFFNHTPAVPDPQKNAALMSGKLRFDRYLDLLARNVRAGETVLGSIPHGDPNEAPVPREETAPVESQDPPAPPTPAQSEPRKLTHRGLFDSDTVTTPTPENN